ncbi:MAG: glycosyltransferase 87 family protein [Pseudomonadota bacterium]
MSIPGAAWLATVASALWIPGYAGAHSGSAVIALHLALTAWMFYFWRCSLEGRLSLPTLIALGVVARLLLIPVAPFTTHDVERYLWDGAVVVAGVDPYVVAPDDAQVAWLRAVWATPEEHAAYPTLYPPLALVGFAVSALAGPAAGIWLWKFLSALASVGVLLLMIPLAAQIGQQRHLPLLAMSPLMLLEAGIGAHVDVWATLAVTAALWAIVTARWRWAGVAIACGAAIKLLPVLLLGPLVSVLSWRQARRVVVAMGLTLGAIYGSALALGFRPLGSLPVFFEKWRFGSPLYDVFAFLEIDAALPLFAIGLLFLACWWARRDLFLGLALALAVPLVVSPVVFPWYLLPLVPLLVLRPTLVGLVWVTLVAVTYEVLDAYNASGVWDPAAWPLWVMGLGVLGALAATPLRDHRLARELSPAEIDPA